MCVCACVCIYILAILLTLVKSFKQRNMIIMYVLLYVLSIKLFNIHIRTYICYILSNSCMIYLVLSYNLHMCVYYFYVKC